MSHVALQRVIARMLYDEAFARAVHADPARALAGVDVTAAERGWLAAADPRAWRLDPLRRTRALKALLDELPASAAVVVAHTGGTAALDAFFSAPAFHDAVQGRGRLVTAFAGWLAGGVAAAAPGLDPAALAAPLAALEGAIALARRGAARPAPPPPAGHVRAASHLALVDVPAGTLAAYQAVLGALRAGGRDPVEALLDPGLRLPALPPLAPGAREALLVEATPGGEVGVEPVSDELHALLAAARQAVPRVAALAAARALGCAPGEDAEVVDDLVAGGLLVAGA